MQTEPVAESQAAELPAVAAQAAETPPAVEQTQPTVEDPTPTPTQLTAAPPSNHIWVANPADQTVLKINTLSNTVEATIPIDGQPETVVTGEGGVWVLDRENDQVLRIDPNSNTVIDAVILPNGQVDALGFGAGSLWVGMTGRVDFENQTPEDSEVSHEQEEKLPPGIVLQIDPQDHSRLNEFSVQPVSQLEVSGTGLWILSRGVIDTPLQVIDISREVGMAVPFHNAPEWILIDSVAVDPGNLWLFSTAHRKIFHATTDGRMVAAIELDVRQPTGYADLLLMGDDLWAATPWGTVLRIHRQTNEILGQIDLRVPLTELIAGDGIVWALSQQTASLYRIDPAQRQVTTVIETGSRRQPTVVPSPTPRVVISKPCADAPNSRLQVGDLAYVTKDPPVPNRVREQPNRLAQVLGHITPGGSMELIEGPECHDGWVWWKVRNANLEGWTAEGDKDTYWLVPLFP